MYSKLTDRFSRLNEFNLTTVFPHTVLSITPEKYTPSPFLFSFLFSFLLHFCHFSIPHIVTDKRRKTHGFLRRQIGLLCKGIIFVGGASLSAKNLTQDKTQGICEKKIVRRFSSIRNKNERKRDTE